MTSAASCQLFMVSIDWAGAHTPSRVTSARTPLDVDEQIAKSGCVFHAWAITHSRIAGERGPSDAQLGIRTDDTVRDSITGNEWLRITAPDTELAWWIEDGAWTEPGNGTPGYHKAPSFRTAGELQLLVGDQAYVIHIVPNGFSQTEFESMQDDFRAGLWTLLMDRKGEVRIEGETESNVDLRRLRDFSRHAVSVLQNPRVNLRRSTELRPFNRAHLDLTSLHDIVVHGIRSKVLTGAHRESFDTAENRFALFLIERVLTTTRLTLQFVESSTAELRVELKQSNASIADPVAKTIKLRKADVQHRLELATTQYTSWKELRDRVLKELSFHPEEEGAIRRDRCLSFTITVRDPIIGNAGLGLRIKKNTSATLSYQHPREEYTVWLPIALHKARVLLPGKSYRISGTIQKRTVEQKDVFEFTRITEIDIEKSILDTYRELQQHLTSTPANEAWIELPATPETIKAWKRELETHKMRQKLLSGHLEKADKSTSSLSEIVALLQNVYTSLMSLGVRPSNILPVSVVFSQTPAYRDLLATYRKLPFSTEVDESTLDLFMQSRRMSVLDLPSVYERWCLIQLIDALRFYGFHPEGEWKQSVVEALERKPDPKPWKVTFVNVQLRREVILKYQEFLNGKRPDFLLELNGIGTDDEQLHLIVVLDAKCKPFLKGTPDDTVASKNTIEWELLDIYSKYSKATGFPAFVLHPSEQLSPYSLSEGAPRSISEFGTGNAPPEGDSADHRFGWILLRPNVKEHIRILTAMLLQYNLEDNRGAYKRPPVLPHFCISCGSNEVQQDKSPFRETGNTKGNSVRCKQCGLITICHYCQSCGNRLWKHGEYWTYHETLLGEPFNIICPHCGFFLHKTREENRNA